MIWVHCWVVFLFIRVLSVLNIIADLNSVGTQFHLCQDENHALERIKLTPVIWQVKTIFKKCKQNKDKPNYLTFPIHPFKNVVNISRQFQREFDLWSIHYNQLLTNNLFMDSSHSKLCFQEISGVSRFHSSNVWNNPSLTCPRADSPSSDLPFQMLLCLDVPGICSKWCGLLFHTSVSS